MEFPSVRQLEYAVAVAQHGNFGRAAEACHVSQPALSDQIKALETRLGVELFERGRRGARLTPEGAAVVERAAAVLEQLRELMEVADSNRADLVGPLTMSVIPTMAPYLLPTVVRTIRRHFPRAEVHLREERTKDVIAALHRGDADVGLLAAPVDDPTLDVADLAEDPFVLTMPSDHPFAGNSSPLPVSVLSGLRVLLLDEGHCLRDQAIGICATAGATTPGEIQATSLASLCQMVAAGMGVTLLPASAVRVEARPGSGLDVRPFRDPQPGRTVVLAWRTRAPRAALIRTLADALTGPVTNACSLSDAVSAPAVEPAAATSDS